MLDRVIVKDWGLMLPIRTYDSEGSVLAKACRFIAHCPDSGSKTSVHRHSCDSEITVVSGQVCVEFDDGEICLSVGDSVLIKGNLWHRVEFTDPGTTIIEWYDHTGIDYPIERHEGEEWPDE